MYAVKILERLITLHTDTHEHSLVAYVISNSHTLAHTCLLYDHNVVVQSFI